MKIEIEDNKNKFNYNKVPLIENSWDKIEKEYNIINDYKTLIEKAKEIESEINKIENHFYTKQLKMIFEEIGFNENNELLFETIGLKIWWKVYSKDKIFTIFYTNPLFDCDDEYVDFKLNNDEIEKAMMFIKQLIDDRYNEFIKCW